jgi:hypothetical protein
MRNESLDEAVDRIASALTDVRATGELGRAVQMHLGAPSRVALWPVIAAGSALAVMVTVMILSRPQPTELSGGGEQPEIVAASVTPFAPLPVTVHRVAPELGRDANLPVVMADVIARLHVDDSRMTIELPAGTESLDVAALSVPPLPAPEIVHVPALDIAPLDVPELAATDRFKELLK